MSEWAQWAETPLRRWGFHPLSILLPSFSHLKRHHRWGTLEAGWLLENTVLSTRLGKSPTGLRTSRPLVLPLGGHKAWQWSFPSSPLRSRFFWKVEIESPSLNSSGVMRSVQASPSFNIQPKRSQITTCEALWSCQTGSSGRVSRLTAWQLTWCDWCSKQLRGGGIERRPHHKEPAKNNEGGEK